MARALDGSDAATRRRIAPSLEYLHSHISDPSLDTARLAAASGLSEAQFRRLFEKIYIVPPRRYIISVRISAAKDLLENQTGVAETAKIVGFTDAESFARLFKRETGATPYDFFKYGDPAKRN
ncbi:MAG: helix-turn-helix domain-containing protein [Eubacteriales bacterium]